MNLLFAPKFDFKTEIMPTKRVTYPVIGPIVCDDGCAKCSGRIHWGAGVFNCTQVANGNGQSNCQWCDIFGIYTIGCWKKKLTQIDWFTRRWAIGSFKKQKQKFKKKTITWFVAITHTEHGENENESEEKFQSQSLHRFDFIGKYGVAQIIVEVFAQQRFKWCGSSRSTGTLANDVQQCTDKANFAGN